MVTHMLRQHPTGRSPPACQHPNCCSVYQARAGANSLRATTGTTGGAAVATSLLIAVQPMVGDSSIHCPRSSCQAATATAQHPQEWQNCCHMLASCSAACPAGHAQPAGWDIQCTVYKAVSSSCLMSFAILWCIRAMQHLRDTAAVQSSGSSHSSRSMGGMQPADNNGCFLKCLLY